MMLAQPSPEDYIIATGQSHTLTEFVKTAFDSIGKDWHAYVSRDEQLMRPTDILRNKVNPSKAAAHLGLESQVRHERSDRHDARCGNEESS